MALAAKTICNVEKRNYYHRGYGSLDIKTTEDTEVHGGFNPHFSPEGGFIAMDFEFTGIFLDERNTDCIAEFIKISVDSKGKRENVILVRNSG